MKLCSEHSSIHHTQEIKAQMRPLIKRWREDVGEITEPRAQALFGTSAEVLTAWSKALTIMKTKGKTHGELNPWRPAQNR